MTGVLQACCLLLMGKKNRSVSSVIPPPLPEHISLVHLPVKLSDGKMPFFLFSAVTPMPVTSNSCVRVVPDCEEGRWSQAEKSDI